MLNQIVFSRVQSLFTFFVSYNIKDYLHLKMLITIISHYMTTQSIR